AEVEDDAVLLVEDANDITELGAQHALEWAPPRRDHVHVDLPGAEGRRDLEPDEAGPEDHRPPRRLGGLDDRAAVLQRAKVVNRRTVAGELEPDGLGSRCENDRAELSRRSVVQGQALVDGIENRDPTAERELHTTLLIVGARVQRVERRRAQSFACTKAEAGVVPGTADGIVHDQPLGERTPVMAAGSADREHLGAAPHEDDRLAVDVTEPWNTVVE